MQLGLARVHGSSMEPTYFNGDLLLVLYGASVQPGAAHLMRLPDGPEGPRPLGVKRISRAEATSPTGEKTWWAERDNPREGVDSWLVGAIPEQDVLGRVLSRVPRRIARALRPRRT